MRILVAGLGLIGGSGAKALKRAGYTADGYDRPEIVRRAVETGVVAAAAVDLSLYEVVFVALPPDAAIEWMKAASFRKDAIVADFCGVKCAPERAIYAQERNFRYVGCHPMAGREVSGLSNAIDTLFDGASMIMVDCAATDADAVQTLEKLYGAMGFAQCKHCTAEYHDQKIAYTSQLAHIVSNAYVKSPTANGFPGFTGGSFQDMTRIAGVDEEIWTRLYMLNREAVESELSCLIGHLQEYLHALRAGDEEGLKVLLRNGRVRKEELDRERKIL